MDFLALLLEHYHRTSKDLEARCALGSFSSLCLPTGYKGFEGVVQRLKKAIENKEKAVIYGDYDVDGLTSTAIRKRTLDGFGLKAGFFIPSRYHEGYGLNSKRVEQFREKGYQLIITVDNGISAKESIALARSLNRDVVVIDHHEIPPQLPDTPYIFTQLTDRFVPYNCSAASLALFVSYGLTGKFDPYFVTLAGRAVFSDVRPLIGNNLILAKQRKKRINTYQYPNLRALLGPKKSIGYDDVVFTLVPTLNSPGRASKDSRATNNACRFLLENLVPPTPKRKKLARELRELNQQRKQRVQDAKFKDDYKRSSEHGAVYVVDGLSGLTGLYANKIRRKEKKAVGVFAQDENDPEVLIGSFRCLSPFEIDPMLKKEEKKRINGGGHLKAIGRSIKKKDYFQIATDFVSLRERQALNKKNQKDEEAISIALEDVNRDNYHLLEKFEPFGEGYPYPSFSVDVEREWGKLSTSGKSMIFSVPGLQGKAIFTGDLGCLNEKRYTYYTLKGKLVSSCFHGVYSCCLRADEIIPHLD